MRFLWLLPLLALGCELPPATVRPPSPIVVDTARVDLDTLAEAHLGGTDHLRRVPSPDDQFLLLVRQAPPTTRLPDPPVSYALVERRSGRVTAGEQQLRATVRWAGPHLLEVRLVRGIVPADPSSPLDSTASYSLGYTVDAATGKRREMRR